MTAPRHPRRPAAAALAARRRRRRPRAAARADRDGRSARRRPPPPPPAPAGCGSATPAGGCAAPSSCSPSCCRCSAPGWSQLQGLDAPTYAAEAEQGRLRTVTLPAARGTITDRNGIALATTRGRRERHRRPDARWSTRRRPRRCWRRCCGIDPHGAAREAHRRRRASSTWPRRVTPATWRKVSDAGPPGPRHRGPARHLRRADQQAGLPGRGGRGEHRRLRRRRREGPRRLEYALDNTLAGRDGTATYELSAGGRRIPSGVDTERDAVPGTDVAADPRPRHPVRRPEGDRQGRRVQPGAERHGRRLRPEDRRPARRGHRADLRPERPGRRAGRGPRQPAADRGLRARQHRQGHHRRGADRGGRDHADHADRGAEPALPGRQVVQGLRGRTASEHLTYAGTIAKSSNIGTIKAAERLGNLKRLYPYLKKFGIGEPTGLGLPGESPARCPTPGDWSATSGYTMAFGQGYSVNAVQMAVGLRDDRQRRRSGAAAAGRGDHRRRTARCSPTPARADPGRQRRGPPRTVRLMLETVLGEGGTAPLARIPGYRVGGKTGTAQRFDPACGCYRGYTAVVHRAWLPPTTRALVVAVTLQAPKVGHRRRLPGAARCSSRWRRSRSSRCGSRRPGPSRPA